MKTVFTIFFSLITVFYSFSQGNNKVIRISSDIELVKLASNVFVHLSNSSLNGQRVSSNGVILINGNKAFLFDTPMTDSLTRILVSWITDTMKLKIEGFVPNHWHADCIGGLDYIKSLGIKSYANQMTIDIARSKNLPLPEFGFKDSTTIMLGNKEVDCYYFGAAHSLDNIVVWIPSEKILFAGCMVKALNYTNLGNTVDGDLNAYKGTLQKVKDRFPDAKIVIPGHGDFGGIELITHTIDLIPR